MALTVALLALLVPACGGGGETGSTAAGSDDPPATGSPAGETEAGDAGALEAERAAVVDAHRAAMQARIDSAAPPAVRPDLPAVPETHVDPMLGEWTSRLAGLQSQGLAIRYPDESELSVEALDVTFGWQQPGGASGADPGEVGDLATLDACIVDDGEIVRLSTGEVTQGGGIFTVRETAVLHKVDGTWKLSERQPHSERPGRTGCAAQ